MNQLLQVQAALQVWVSENQDSPDVERVQQVIDHLAKLSETPFGTEFGKELLARWVLGEFDE